MKSSHLGAKPAKECFTGLPILNKLVGQKARVKPEDRERKAKPLPSRNKEGIHLLERQIETTSKQIASPKNSILQTLHFLFPELE